MLTTISRSFVPIARGLWTKLGMIYTYTDYNEWCYKCLVKIIERLFTFHTLKPHFSNFQLRSIWRDKVILHQCVCKIIWQSSHWLFFFIGILWALQTRLVRTWRRESCDGSLVMTVKIERIHDFQQWSLSKTVLKRPSLLTEEKELLWSWDRMIWTLGGWNNRIIWPQNQDRSLQN